MNYVMVNSSLNNSHTEPLSGKGYIHLFSWRLSAFACDESVFELLLTNTEIHELV